MQLSFHLVKYKTHFHCKLITEKNKKVINRSGMVDIVGRLKYTGRSFY